MSVEPIIPTLPSTVAALERKYDPASTPYTADILPLLPRPVAYRPPGVAGPIPTPATLQSMVAPLQRFDLRRARQGQMPLTARQSAKALQTLATGQPATPPREQSLFNKTLGNLRDLVTAVPKLPLFAVKELQALPDLPGQLQQTLATADNPLQALGNAATLPGLRLAPGAFVAEQLFSNAPQARGVQGLIDNPLFTLLDVAPLASGAAKTTRVSRAAQDAYRTQVETAVASRAPGTAPGAVQLPSRPRPLQTVLTRRLDDQGAVVPNRLGQATQSAADLFYSTPQGRAFEATFKERDTARLESRYTSTLRQMADPTVSREALPTQINGRDITPELDLRDAAFKIERTINDLGVTPERNEQLYALAENPRLPDGTPTSVERLPGITPDELILLRDIQDFNDLKARVTEGDLTQRVSIDGTPEVYDLRTAKRVTSAQGATARAQRILDAREAVVNRTMTPDEHARLSTELTTDVQTGTITKAQGNELQRLYDLALDETRAGIDLQPFVQALRPYARAQPLVTRLIDHLNNGRWAAANRDLASLSKRSTFSLPIDLDGFRAEMTRLSKRDRALRRTADITPKTVERLQKIQQRIEAGAIPARFTPAAEALADEAIAARVGEIYSGAPDLDRMIDLARERIYDPISQLPEAEIRALQREARQSWKALRDAGMDPIFFHRASPGQAARREFIRVSDAPVTPATARARMFDPTPHVPDMGAALTDDALQLLQRRGTQAFLDTFSRTYGRTRAQLSSELLERAKGRHEGNLRIPLQQHLSDLINERWALWDGSKFQRGRPSPAFSVAQREAVYVPRVMLENIERLYSPPLPKLTRAMDLPMKLFRTSVLPLAPRWHIYNAIGGATMMAAESPGAFRHLPDTISALWREKRSGIPADVRFEGAPPAGFGTLPPEARAWDAAVKANSPLRDRLAAAHNYAAGRTLRSWYDTARASRLSKVKDGFNRGVQASYDYNQMVDDMYRSAIGISSKRKALKAGWSDDAAEALAVQSIRRVFQSWDEMTPMERSVMRSIVPFYGWTAHILRYAFRYPLDHPLRVAILGSFARAELTDALTGLPEHIRDMVLMGDLDARGVVKGLNVGPFNPFRDVPSTFTVGGFLGNLNPLLTGTLESVGVDTMRGGPQLYPEMRYDPESGRLVADPSGNLLSNIVGNISPQTNLFTALIGRNEAFNELLARDPEAAGRQLLSNAGIPVFFRSVDVGEELIRSEMARMEDQDTARKEALKSGDLSILDRFPGLQAYGEQIRALESQGLLDQLRPEAYQLGAETPAGKAYAVQAAMSASG